jgi:acyl-CoA thioesterase-2
VPQDLLDGLVTLLDLEQLDDDLFRGVSPSGTLLARVFGGQVAAQALVAAVRTVSPERTVHSLHGYFLIGGDPTIPIVYEVGRVRDGGSFSVRRVVAVQNGEPIFYLTASFHRAEAGVDHRAPMPDVPMPEELPRVQDLLAPYIDRLPMGDWWAQDRPLDLRYVGSPPALVAALGGRHAASSQVWFRADGVLPDDPALHVCLLAYASDMTLLDSALMRHGIVFDGRLAVGASLDHAMWFHRPFRADEWLLYDQTSPNASGGRGLGMGRIYTRDGELVCSVVQEGLIRTPKDPGEGYVSPGMPLSRH